MTRGRQVQELIKENKKTARQIWEEHDWKYNRQELFSKSVPHLKIVDEIEYRDGHKKIVFDLISISYACMDNSGEFEAINMDDNKLIQAQLKELGWI